MNAPATHTPHPTTILITGASSGLGAALAREYAAPGITLHLLGRDSQRLQAVANDCRAKGAELRTACIDVTDREAMAAYVTRADDATSLDLVIANAGVSAGTFAGVEQLDAAHHVFDVNLQGVLHTLHPVLPRMVARRAGQVAIISSLAGMIAFPGAAAYSASKAAVRYYGDALRAVHARDNLAISIICPGWIRTPLTDINHFPMPLMMSAERAAGIIRRGLAKKKARIAFPLTLYCALRLIDALPLMVQHALLRAMPETWRKS
jgi:NADP-dependent 3-hydroxy acid dehydrogenase YdfG